MSLEASNTSLTIKAASSHDDFDAPWIVLYGTPESLRAQLADVMGWGEDADRDGLSLATLASTASVEFKAQYALASSGAKPTTAAPRKATTSRSTQAASTPAAPATPPPADEPESDTERVLALIEATASTDELKDVWANNNEHFDDNKPLQAAYSAKRKSFNTSK